MVIHQIPGSAEGHDFPGIQRHAYLYQVAVADGAVLHIGVVDGADIVIDEEGKTAGETVDELRNIIEGMMDQKMIQMFIDEQKRKLEERDRLLREKDEEIRKLKARVAELEGR